MQSRGAMGNGLSIFALFAVLQNGDAMAIHQPNHQNEIEGNEQSFSKNFP